jgi:NTP pyrophosphatase (non-canonical NTP hydrolase)
MTVKDLREKLSGRLTELNAHERKLAVQELSAAYAKGTKNKLHLLQLFIGDWRRDKGFRTDIGNVPEKLMLIVTELSEAMEAYRHLSVSFINQFTHDPQLEHIDSSKHAEDLTWWLEFEEELADTAVRLLDLCDALDVDLYQAICHKMAINELRAHKHGKER